MAPKQKRRSPLNDPPPIESEEDQEPSHEQQEADDDDEGGGETASSDEQEGDDEQEKHRLSRTFQPPPRNPSLSKPQSSSSESATESDSDSEPETPTPTPNTKVKPLASKLKEQPPKVKQQQSSSAATQPKSASKRPAENNGRSPDPKQPKKKKVEAADVTASDDEDAKKSTRDDSKKLFQRVFSDQDEIAVLEGMVEFRSAMGGDDPYKCSDAFRDFMMKRSKRLSFDASSGQLKEKIRRLKTKFNNNARRGKNGEPPKFLKPHDQRAFELSQVIWGEGTAGGGGGVINGDLVKTKPNDGKEGKKITNLKKEIISENAEKLKPKPEAAKAKLDSDLNLIPADSKELGNVDERTEKIGGLGSLIRYDKVLGEYGLGEDFLRKGDGLMEASKRADFEGKWAKLDAAELELRVKRAELYASHAKSMLQLIKSSRN